MLLESVTIDFRCSGCHTVRRIDVKDMSLAVWYYRPDGWRVIGKQAFCRECAVQKRVVVS